MLIRRVLDRATTAMAPLDRPVMTECLEFFFEFAELAHDGSEEQVLFSALKEWTPEISDGAVQAVRAQHDLTRRYLAKARTALGAGPEHRTTLLENVQRYIEAMRLRLVKEDEALFDLVQLALPPSRDEEIVRRMTLIRREYLSDERYEQWVQVASGGAQAGTLVLRKAPDTAPMPVPKTTAAAQVMDARTLSENKADGTKTRTASRGGGVLFNQGGHAAVQLQDFGQGLAVQSNHFVIIDQDEAMILDPGGPKVYPNVFASMIQTLGQAKLRFIFLSHQDPDIGTALNAWLMDTKAEALISNLWTRFMPHFGIDKLMSERLKGIPDEGQWLTLGRRELLILPAHFLHSCGNFQIYDPMSKILFSGDLGATVGVDAASVSDFEAHRPYLESFHRRYMGSTRAMSLWANMVRTLDIETIAPQHGPLFQGKDIVAQFVDWATGFECGIDALEHLFTVPPRN